MKITLSTFQHAIATTIFFAAINTSQAQVVDVAGCSQLTSTKKPFILRLPPGSKIAASIEECANNAKLTAVALSGLGAVKDPTIAYFNMDTKQYEYKTFYGNYELTALNGNLLNLPDRDRVHAHITIAGKDYQALAGHLAEAEVASAGIAEISFLPL